jgi:hypothetical protein
VVSNLEILEIFGVSSNTIMQYTVSNSVACQYKEAQEIENLQYVQFLLMARAGLRALEYYDPEAKKHQQAHMQARCVQLLSLVYLLHADVVSLKVWVSRNS